MTRRRTCDVVLGFWIVGAGVLGAQPPHCDLWNTESFFASATRADVVTCLDAGADVKARSQPRPHSPGGITPLHYAAALSEDPAVPEALIAAGADVSARTFDGFTPLFGANAMGIEVLLAAGADVNARNVPDGFSPLHTAALRGRPSEVEILLEAGADVNARMGGSTTPLSYGLRANRSAAAVELLLEAGADFSDDLLHSAATRGDPASVGILLAAGVDANARDAEGQTAAFEAARNSPEAFEVLLAAGANLNVRDNDGNTLLHAAAQGEDPAVVERLLTAEADIDVRNDYGEAPIHSAAQWSGWAYGEQERPEPGRRSTVVVELLLAAGADVEARDSRGWTPLHAAAMFNYNPAVVELLLAAGADVNARGGDGSIPLHRVVDRGPFHHPVVVEAVVELLLASGANLNATNDQGNTPLDVARRTTTRELLRAHMSSARPAATDDGVRPVR